ncbi:MAG: response regulator [Deltaproteobacteria bacterium]|nr:response regulator [Deltaproteobacteria bacterium]
MRQRHILAVDDEPLILRSVERALSLAGHAVSTAGSGPAARALLEDHSYDVIVTDIAMEGFGGLEVLRQAKQADPDVCVVVVTGYCDVATAIEALRLGAEDYLSKPFDFDELLLRVSHCLDKRELRRKLRFYEHILPVCSGCQRIRDDAGREPGTGEWMPLEEYVSRVAGSPGHCPACAAQFAQR